MAYIFGDSFDPYAARSDIAAGGYWDTNANLDGSIGLATGRYTGQAISISGATGTTNCLIKTSAVNDSVHHFVCAFRQTAALSLTNIGSYFSLLDGSTAQCSVAFVSDGSIRLYSGAASGTLLATYAGAVTLQNQWFAFEIEIVVHNTSGSIKVRTNGATSDSFSATGLNTRGGTANNYANKLLLGMNTAVAAQQIDDFLWRSDASSVPWVGDIRCYTRMPVSDQSVAFSRAPLTATQTPFTPSSSTAVAAATARYTPFTALYDGTIVAATVTLATSGYTGNMKCSLFASSGTGPTTVLGSATVLVNPTLGPNALTFGTPVAVVKGTQYWIGFSSDTSAGFWSIGTATAAVSSATSYASFPVASPAVTSGLNPVICSLTYSIGANNNLVCEAQQDGATTYVYSSTVGQADLYGIAGIGVTPASTIAVTTRAFAQKSDAGSRSGTVQAKSGGTTVDSGSTTLSTGFSWLWRTDANDPATGAAWTPTAVNNLQVGPKVTA